MSVTWFRRRRQVARSEYDLSSNLRTRTSISVEQKLDARGIRVIDGLADPAACHREFDGIEDIL